MDTDGYRYRESLSSRLSPNQKSCYFLILNIPISFQEQILVFKYVSEKDEWPICHEIPVGGIFRTFVVQQYMLFIDWTDAKRICCYDTTTRAIRTLEPIKNEVYVHYFAAEFENKLYLFADLVDKRKVNV